MATVNKNFKVKNGLIVEGTTATVNNFDVLTKKQDDQDYIVGLIGGTATSANEADKVVKRDANGDFAAGTITADIVGDVTGTVSDISNHSTSDLSEGTNLYYTDSRARGAFSAGAGIQIDGNGLVRADISTGIEYKSGDSGPIRIDRATVDTWYDAAGSASTAQSNANSYTDGRETAITTAYQTYADQAETDANAYTDGRETAITAAYQSYADTAEADARAYTDQEVAALVNGAPELLDTLNELAAAINDDASFATTIGTSIGERVAKSGDTMTGALTLHADPENNLEAATKQYVDTAETDANTYADNAVSDHSDLTTGVHGISGDVVGTTDAQTLSNKTIDGTLVIGEGSLSSISGLTGNIYIAADNHMQLSTGGDVVLSPTGGAYVGIQDPANKIATEGYVNDQDTDDVAEGVNNLYFTDARARAAAVQLLTTSPTSTSNITITENQFGWLDITAENGVADSTTDDLAEGETNLYFTDERAVDALEAVVPDFTAVEINSVAKQVAATLSASTAGIHTAFTWDPSVYGSAEFLVKVSTGSHSEISKVLITKDGAVFPNTPNLAITEYGIVGTNGSLATVSAEAVTATTADLIVTTVNNDTVVTVMGTLLA